jgi:matrixin
VRSFCVAVTLVAAVVASACGGGPIAPSVATQTGPPPPAVVTVSLSSLSLEARAVVQMELWMSRTQIQRWADGRDGSNPIRVFIGPYTPELVARATGIWERYLPLRFQPVTVESEGEILLYREYPETWEGSKSCGGGVPTVRPPAIIGGKVTIGVGVRPDRCLDQGNILVAAIAHEIGHVLGFGHTPNFTDLMSPVTWTLDLSAPADEAVRFIYGSPLGAKVMP